MAINRRIQRKSITLFFRFGVVVSLFLLHRFSSTAASSLDVPFSTCFITSSRKMAPTSFCSSISAGMRSQSSFIGRGIKPLSQYRNYSPRKGMQLGMLLGTDSGILGVGAPEVVVTLLVGYFILGPSELYKITKDIGKFIQNFRTLGSEATKSFETAMEDQLQMQEIRKAQRELNNAFSFRRSINVDEDAEAFTETKRNEDLVTDDTDTTIKKKKKRRVKRKISVESIGDEIETSIPDLDATDAFLSTETGKEDFSAFQEIRTGPRDNEILSNNVEGDYEMGNVNHNVGEARPDQSPSWSEVDENARFTAQLNDNWNQRILDNEDKLSPLAQVMEKLALLEEEREMINQRLEEEFKLRKQNDEKFYQQKRALLENAAQQISTSVYGSE